MSNYDGTSKQSIRWTSFKDSHRTNNSQVNINHTLICITKTQKEYICYSAESSRSSHRHKMCVAPEDFTPSEEIHVEAALTECIWTEFRRCTMLVSPSPPVQSTFDR